MGEPAEYPSAPKLSAAEWKALSERVILQVVDAFSGSDEFLGKQGAKLVARWLKPGSLASHTKVSDVTAALVFADAAGADAVVSAATIALFDVPFTGNMMNFEPIQQAFCGAYRRSLLSGGTGEPFCDHLEIPVLDITADKQDEWRQLHLRRANGSEYERLVATRGIDPDASVTKKILAATIKLQELHFMWVQNSGPDWPRDRIDAEIAMYAEKLRELDVIA